jgi:hypothetical protein
VLALHHPLSLRRGVLTVNRRESAVQVRYVNLKVVDKLQVMENTKVSNANQIMSDETYEIPIRKRKNNMETTS